MSLQATFAYGFNVGSKYLIDKTYLQENYPNVCMYSTLVLNDPYDNSNVENVKVFYGVPFSTNFPQDKSTVISFDDKMMEEVDKLYDEFKNYLKKFDNQSYLEYGSGQCNCKAVVYGDYEYYGKKYIDPLEVKRAEEREKELKEREKEREEQEKKEDAKFQREAKKIMKQLKK